MRTTVLIRMPRELRDRLQAFADEAGLDLSEYLRLRLVRSLKLPSHLADRGQAGRPRKNPISDQPAS